MNSTTFVTSSQGFLSGCTSIIDRLSLKLSWPLPDFFYEEFKKVISILKLSLLGIHDFRRADQDFKIVAVDFYCVFLIVITWVIISEKFP